MHTFVNPDLYLSTIDPPTLLSSDKQASKCLMIEKLRISFIIFNIINGANIKECIQSRMGVKGLKKLKCDFFKKCVATHPFNVI